MSQSPGPSDPAQPQSVGYGQSPGEGQNLNGGYGQSAGGGYGQQQGQPPAYGAQDYAYSQQAYGQQAAYGAAPYGQAGYAQPKSKAVAALLAFFLGRIGIHNFYRGQTRKGIIHLCLVGAALALIFTGGMIINMSTDDAGNMSDGATAAAVSCMVAGLLPALGNQIWSFVEFILILVSNDGTLQ
ncbi:TM2 domain-containing protein [Actinomyces ruminicola]|uniref:TM2 domain-containing protein n=1 Tax=Actinomyces ruminicola TaxID=332524 RepID=A0A1G9WTG2_9ACTO|nr:TM2 domain-containing protein [Actinomyces ruminicola]SDM87423.1 TM2 domain-containing protein [Actinomyces ruminicola]